VADSWQVAGHQAAESEAAAAVAVVAAAAIASAAVHHRYWLSSFTHFKSYQITIVSLSV